MVQADRTPFPPAPARKDCWVSAVDFMVRRRFVSLGGESDLGCRAVLGERRPRLVERLVYCRFCLPRDSGDSEGERPRFEPYARGPRAFSAANVVFANCSSSLKVSQTRGAKWGRGCRVRICRYMSVCIGMYR